MTIHILASSIKWFKLQTCAFFSVSHFYSSLLRLWGSLGLAPRPACKY